MYTSDYIILALLAGIWLVYIITRGVQRRRLAARMAQASRRVNSAVEHLQTAGYAIEDVDRRVPVQTVVDGRTYRSQVEADYLVRRGGRRFVVVTSGGQTERVTNRKSRSRLLEYYTAFRPNGGILLLDTEKGKVRNIQVKVPGQILVRTGIWLGYLVAFGIGVLAAYVLLRLRMPTG